MEWLRWLRCKHWASRPVILIALFVAVHPQQTTGLDSYICAPGLHTPGVTVPNGDIILEYGSPLEILCVLNPWNNEGRNASSLIFYHNAALVPPEFLSVVNSTTLRLYVEKPPPSNSMYYCKLKANPELGLPEVPVCLNTVAVGYKPMEVQNFSCISHNWDNLTCTWTPPLNYVKTTYKLVYYLPGRAGGRFSYACPDNTDVRENRCFWDQSTSNPYRQPYEYYYFVMTAENAFGNLTSRIKFHHYAHVIPSKAINLTLIEKTSSSALIQWSVGYPMQNFPPGVVQKVEYQSQWDNRDYWQVVNTSHLNIKNASHRLNITDLTHAHTFYDIRVFMRSAAAIGDDKWSQPATITVKTRPTIPGAAPKTDIGSFEVTGTLNSRDIYVYWQQIPEDLFNGDNFEYRVISVEEDGLKRNLYANETTKAYAKFKGLSLNSYRFKIVSSNQEGYSLDFAEVFVPAHSKSVPEPLSFTKIAFDHRIYELSWRPPAESYRIHSYTIFWCENKMDRPYQCTGYLNWTHVPKDVTIKNITVPEDKIYQFAIAANSKTESSGMVWASCTVIHNKVLGKMRSVWINRIGSTFIEVGWKLECSDRIGEVEGFRIYYCPIVSPYNTTCKVPEKNTTIPGDIMMIHGNVTGLTPYTTYMVTITVLTKSGEGQPSDKQYKTTLEAAPDTPQDVAASEITNTSMLVTWKPPAAINGVLRYYIVHYNDIKINAEHATEMRLVNLSSYTNYSISISACTVVCSEMSPPIYAQTAIGQPGIMDRPTVRFINSSQVLVSWMPPFHPAGYLDYYEVMVEQSDGQHNSSKYKYNSTGTESQVPIPDCDVEGLHLRYTFSVRAVNIGPDNTTYYGPWSNPGEGSCYASGPSQDIMVIIWVFSLLVFSALALAFGYISKRIWYCCKEMQNVEVKLPPGLAPPIEKEKDQEHHLTMHGWTKQPRSENEHKSQADQELLLQKKETSQRDGESEGDQASVGEGDGDSSGCSSGHDSVSSSITSGTHISSDSGTEVDQRAPSPDGVFSEASPPTSLRQRNVGTVSSSSDTGNSKWERGEPYVMIGGSNSSLIRSTPNLSEGESSGYMFLDGYCRVGGGIPTRTAPTSGSGYVSLPPPTTSAAPRPAALPTASSGYVTHPAWWGENKEPRSPPAAPVAPAPAASKGYVMAGETGTPSSYCRLGWEKPSTRTQSDYVPHRQLDSDL